MPGRDDICFIPEGLPLESAVWHVVLNPSMLYIGSLVEDRPGEIVYLNLRTAGNC